MRSIHRVQYSTDRMASELGIAERRKDEGDLS